jgi:protein-L-isoaspartate(D-aspartate) O-methyltransferase
LARLATEVYGIELEPELHARSVATLAELGIANVHLRRGDGFLGWPERAPFDAIVLSCAIEELPAPLWEQLAAGGRVVYPKGPAGAVQSLVVVTKTPAGPREEHLAPVQFVPLRRERGGRPRVGRARAATLRPIRRSGRAGSARTRCRCSSRGP